ncbi:centrosomal protein of 68 kDa isoform X3 [Aquila chrysaetos chrysaetos]|uniref:Centrosomal protein 68 n=1 Tax=Aquila chrysaetos chrysaetos TaxID=223781 RepID=A0A663E9Y3_AQUCH|nr:centrosomal protein of 68 kDa isoform X3 [Aquila chrysaetos chrysaetos]XP_029878832.1 centrosomal protein of 68 kDa isoform X3 [Aquila chrysaetos chrysaetos]XP_029878833.1 centrosomal protein of 68 kDa isoform X3 [Aquila chrysaetos chrysaetos]XP_029878835.1 centrosomal protein of 68 kDa isoform X3 [Aquila chrysaetos chrysaetos]
MRAQGLAASCRRSSVPMAVDVGKSPSEASLSGKAEGDGRWDCAEVETDYPELVDSLCQLLGAEEAKPCSQGTESMAMSGRSRLATSVTQGGSSYRQEVSSASTSRFPRDRASLSETEMLIYRAVDGDVPHHVSHRFLSPEEQQVKASGCWEPASSPPSQRGSAEESILAGSCHDARAGQWSRRLAAQSPLSTPEVLRPPTSPSPESALRSHSTSSLSALSSEENGLSEEPAQSMPASADVSSPAGTATRDLCCWWAAAEGRAPRARKLFSPLLDDCTTVERIREMSSYQANYWACAIPDSLPPSPDRRSPHWNPNKEYEDLLDYAYPLKPRYKLGKMPEPFLHDSGIGLDSFSVSPEGTSRSTSIYGRGGQAQGSGENGRWGFVASADRFSTPGPGKRGRLGAGSYYEPLPIAKASFAKSASSRPSRDSAKDVTTESAKPGSSGRPAADGRSWCTRGSPFPNYSGQAKSTSSFLPTTGVLPLKKEWEGDEEFLSLPPRLQELERLAQFLSNLALTIRMPGHDHRNLPRHSDGRQPLSSELAPFGEVGARDKRGNIEDYAGLWHSCSSQKPSWEDTESCGRIHRDPLRGLHVPTGLGGTLDGTYLNEPRVKGHLKKSQEGESLAQCVKMFCCQLEELIRWLYNVADITDSWVPASLDAESVKASLHRYLEFRKDVANHRSLTESVLERGEALLDCMALNSPALKDTLGLIAKQSEELESHAEHLYESVLAAVSPMQGEDGMEDKGVQQTAAQWPKRRRKQGRSQNGCPIVFKCVSGEEQCDETQDRDESDGSSSEGPREPAVRSLSVRLEGSSGVHPAHTAALLKSLGQQREDGKGVLPLSDLGFVSQSRDG